TVTHCESAGTAKAGLKSRCQAEPLVLTWNAPFDVVPQKPGPVGEPGSIRQLIAGFPVWATARHPAGMLVEPSKLSEISTVACGVPVKMVCRRVVVWWSSLKISSCRSIGVPAWNEERVKRKNGNRLVSVSPGLMSRQVEMGMMTSTPGVVVDSRAKT